MKTPIAALLFMLLVSISVISQTCFESSREVKPTLTAEVRKKYEADLAKAFADRFQPTARADQIIWLGRRTAYLGNYKDAIRIYAEGLKSFPDDARLHRHRGHRFITIRCFDVAIKDLEIAAAMIKGKPDQVEPDGLPNVRNIPTSTLHFNIWYHLGLAYYLKGDLNNALRAYDEAEKVAKNPDMLVAVKHWQYMTLRRMGKPNEAAKAVEAVPDGLDIIENHDYYTLIKLYQGKLSSERLLSDLETGSDSLSSASLGYGLGNRFLYDGRPEEAIKVFRRVLAGDQWASFGYIAAQADLNRLGAK